MGLGTKEDGSITGRVWAGRISPCCSPFLLGTGFETYEPFISLIFQFYFGQRITVDTESADTEAILYSGPSSYDRPDIRTTWVTTKILVMTYDQSLELRPECRSGPKRVSACAVVN
jgi:hypothetical protein